MPQVKAITLSPTATDADGIAQSQSPSGAGNLTINGALASGGSVTLTQAQHVTITSAGNDSARTFTITGTNREGYAQTEAVTGANAGVATSSGNFLTITQIAVDDATAAAVTAGVDGTCESQWYPTDYRAEQFNIGFGVTLSSGANLTYTVQHTFDDVQASDFLEYTANTFNNDTVAGETTAQDGNYTNPPTAIRLAITAHTAGSVTLRIVPNGGA